MKKLFLFLLLLSVLNEAPMLSPITVTTYQTEKVLPSTIIHKTLVINSYVKNKETFHGYKYLSFLENTYTFSGGAHPDIQNRAHTFSLITGKELTLEDLFPIPKEALENKIKNWIFDVIKNNPEEYYPDAANIIDSMQLESFNFYIKNNHVVIFFNPYDIAPYAKGLTEFIIG